MLQSIMNSRDFYPLYLILCGIGRVHTFLYLPQNPLINNNIKAFIPSYLTLVGIVTIVILHYQFDFP